MWFGTAGVGLCRYDGQGLSWLYEERLTTTPGGGAFGIRSVYQDRADDYWICNTRQRFEISADVTVEKGHRMVRYETKVGLPGAQSETDPNFDYFPSITEDREGAIWMACGHAGVWKYDGGAVTKHAIGDGAYSLVVYCDRQGRLWVGTVEDGVYTFEGDGFEPFLPNEMSPARDVRG